jgi:ornithine carbamoyltransferase
MIFEKPSLRTRVSFDVGIHQLGGFSVNLGQAEISLGKREAVSDVARNLERMVQGIMIRAFDHGNVEKMAQSACIPVINGLTDFSHPCQALADYMTILEVKGKLRGVKIAYIGDGNNVAHSLIYGAVRFGASHHRLSRRIRPDSAVKWAKENSAETDRKLGPGSAAAAEAADVISPTFGRVWV